MQKLDAIRAAALDEMERRQRHFVYTLAGAAALEGALILTFLLLADLGNRDHLLLLVAAVLVYGTLGLGLFALGVHVNRATARVITAVELLRGELVDAR